MDYGAERRKERIYSVSSGKRGKKEREIHEDNKKSDGGKSDLCHLI